MTAEHLRSLETVAQLASSYAPHVGGVEEVVRELAHHHARQGARPLVLTMRWPKELPAEEELDGVPVRRYLFRLPEPTPRHLLAYARDGARIQRSVDRHLVAHGATLVHVQCVSGNGWYGATAARRLRVPLVVSVHGELTMDADDVYRQSRVLPGLLLRLARRADLLTACSGQALDDVEAFTGMHLGPRGAVIHGGVDVAAFAGPPRSAPTAPFFLAAGRHVPQKGFDLLLEAYRLLISECPGAPRLVLAGDGPERARLGRLARHLDIADRVELPGWCDRLRIVELFRSCAAFVLPSRQEPFGIVNLEAMAAGKPVVASRVGGVPEIVVDNRTGLLVPPGDPRRLAAALARLIAEPGLACRLGQEGLRLAPHHDWSRVGAHFDEAYAEARRRAAQRIDQ